MIHNENSCVTLMIIKKHLSKEFVFKTPDNSYNSKGHRRNSHNMAPAGTALEFLPTSSVFFFKKAQNIM